MMRDRKTSGKRRKFGQTEDNFVALWPGHQAGAVIFKHVRRLVRRNPRISSLLIQRTTTFLKLFFRDG